MNMIDPPISHPIPSHSKAASIKQQSSKHDSTSTLIQEKIREKIRINQNPGSILFKESIHHRIVLYRYLETPHTLSQTQKKSERFSVPEIPLPPYLYLSLTFYLVTCVSCLLSFSAATIAHLRHLLSFFFPPPPRMLQYSCPPN